MKKKVNRRSIEEKELDTDDIKVVKTIRIDEPDENMVNELVIGRNTLKFFFLPGYLVTFGLAALEIYNIIKLLPDSLRIVSMLLIVLWGTAAIGNFILLKLGINSFAMLKFIKKLDLDE